MDAFSFLLNKYLEVDVLGHEVSLFLTLHDTEMISHRGYTILYAPSNGGQFQLLHILANNWYCWSFHFSHSNGCEVITPCSFNLQF